MANDLKEGAPGISFSSYMGNFGNTSADINSGFSFDLPLSVIQAGSDTALSFLRGNTQQNQALFVNTVARSQDQVSNTADRAFRYQENAMSNMNAMSNRFGQTVDTAIKSRSRGFCFITTAICEHDGKPDDCDELTTLRGFRDGYMQSKPELVQMVKDYYEIAPAIVQAIKERDNEARIWKILRDGYLDDAVQAVKAGDNEKALGLYLEMVDAAQAIAKEG